MIPEEFEERVEENEATLEINARRRRIVVAATSIFLIVVILTSILPRPRDAGQRAVLAPRFTPNPAWTLYNGRTVNFWHPETLGQAELTVRELDASDPFAPNTPFDHFVESGTYTGAAPVFLVLARGGQPRRSASGFFHEVTPRPSAGFRLIGPPDFEHPDYDMAGGIFEYSGPEAELRQLHMVIRSHGLFWQVLVSAPSQSFAENEAVIEEMIKSLFIIPYPVDEELALARENHGIDGRRGVEK